MSTILIKKQINLDENLNLLEHFRDLKPNWNSYDAEPIPSAVIDTCKIMCSALTIQPQIFPCADQSVQMEFDFSDGSYFEIEVHEHEIGIFEQYLPEYSCSHIFSIPRWI